MAEEQAQQETEPVAPTVAEAVETPPEPEAAPEETKKAEPEPGKKQPWFLQRISETTTRAQQAEERAQAAERKAQEYEAMIERLRQGDKPPTPPISKSPIEHAPADRRAEIAAEAQRQRLYEDSLDVRNKGVAQFGSSFGETLNILQAVGATTDDFVADVLAVDRASAHILLDRIAKDPERAVTLAQMTSRQRIAELTRINMAAVAEKTETKTEKPVEPAKKTTSKAPPPPPPITPSASKEVDWRSDEASDEEFTRGFDEMMKKRAARR